MDKYIYRLDKVNFYYYDYKDDENVEDRYVLGYFSSVEEIEKASRICEENGIVSGELEATRFDFCYKENQKFVYELSYGYSILNKKKQYVDYSYVFAPQNSSSDCKKLKKELLKIEKYMPNKNKIFDDEEAPDGFWIVKLTINKLYGVILKNKEKRKAGDEDK